MRAIGCLVWLCGALSWAAQAAAASEAESSVRPGVNEHFLAEDLDVARFTEIFEGESREIYTARSRIVEQLDLRPGMAVADIGAGTGLFLTLFDRAVAPSGKVYAVDISPMFLSHLRERTERESLSRVAVVEGKARAPQVAAQAIDVAFVCDTYHHFEFPRTYSASLYEAIRPGGALIVVDFKRIPGESRDWVLEHVRAGRDVFVEEIESAGFVLEKEILVDGLAENYMLRFRRP